MMRFDVEFFGGVIVGLAVGLVLGVTVARAHDHPQNEAERFYTDWMRPDDREKSCCNSIDCYPTEMKNVGGTWFALKREDGAWVPIPAEKIEHERDNPDGRNHVCMNPEGFVYCAIVGGGT